jgi:site-specific DNA-cytosine methylase
VFVVGYLGDWRVAAAVLFERESLQGNTKPSRKKREEVTANAEGSVGTTVFAGNQQSEIAATIQTTCDDYSRADGFNVIIDRAAFNQGENAQYEPRIEAGETMSSLVARGPHAVAQPIAFDTFNQTTSNINQTIKSPQGGVNESIGVVAQPIAIQDVRPIEKAQNGRGWNDDGTSYTVDTKATQGVAQPIAYSFDALSSNSMKSSNPNSGCRAVDVAKTLDTATPEPSKNQGGIAIAQPIAFKVRGGCEGGGKGYLGQEEQAFTISTMQDQQIAQPIAVDTYNYTTNDHTTQTIRSQSDTEHIGAVLQSMAIRRLTPKECERLQGFPDDWTKIPYRNKPVDQCPDGPRYKACGNSMAVPVMRWIGERINLIESIL